MHTLLQEIILLFPQPSIKQRAGKNPSRKRAEVVYEKKNMSVEATSVYKPTSAVVPYCPSTLSIGEAAEAKKEKK